MNIKRLNSRDASFAAAFEALTSTQVEEGLEVDRAAREIVAAVRRDGDTALLEYTRRFDRLEVNAVADLEVPAEARIEALASLPAEQADALRHAASRIRSYHERQLDSAKANWQHEDEHGVVYGQQVRALDRAGLYVPGGKAAYPSSVLMNAIPARVAGVEEVVMTVPAPGGELSPMVLAAAAVAGVDRVFKLGGAQAVAALAYGTQTVPRADIVVGPGNAYVAAAKRIVFGAVGIDMFAGPSEVVILSDGSLPADWVAMDMFAQAEHDEMARAIVISNKPGFLDEVQKSVHRLLPDMERAEIISTALADHGALIEVADLEEGLALVERLAPEHLELATENARDLRPRVRNAGAIFVGSHSAEALGDYCAGPNHVLPTAGTARFSSPLGVYDFVKRTSYLDAGEAGAAHLAATASVLARSEGLTAHARSAEQRMAPVRS